MCFRLQTQNRHLFYMTFDLRCSLAPCPQAYHLKKPGGWADERPTISIHYIHLIIVYQNPVHWISVGNYEKTCILIFQEPFRSLPDSVLKTLIMMSGEFDYGTIFLREGEEAMGPVPFPFVSYAGYQSHRLTWG